VDAILADKSSVRADKFLASQSIQYALPGVPATYIHSLLGSRNWVEGVEQTGRARSINREKLQVEKLISDLNNPDSFRAKVFFPYLGLIKIRARQKAFHPNAGFEILDIGPKFFAIKRYHSEQVIFAITNISSSSDNVSPAELGISDQTVDLISGERIKGDLLEIKPYQYVWLSNSDNISNSRE
jgi:sucrose phosphorylase